MTIDRRRTGIALSIIWAALICSWLVYEWQLPFYQKKVFFEVLPSPETIIGGGQKVVTPLRYGSFLAALLAPLGVLWITTLLLGPKATDSSAVGKGSDRPLWIGVFAVAAVAHIWTTAVLVGGHFIWSIVPRGIGAMFGALGVTVVLLVPLRLYLRKDKTVNWWAIYALGTAVVSALSVWSRFNVAEYERNHPPRPNNALHSDAPRPAGSGFPRSFHSLGAGERQRWASHE